jgi:F-type H+-transporting ATPase subunit epsilon
MDHTFQLRIVTPDREVVRDEAEEMQIPGREGYLGVLPGHAPLISELKIGEITYRKGAKVEHLAVTWGFLEILPGQVTVLVEAAEKPEEIDVDRAKAARERAEKRLKSPDPEVDLNRAQVAMERALIRLQVAARRGQ